MPTCFVVMGFGKKTDFESGRVFDLDKSYRNVIKPAIEAAGIECVRADEIVHSGLIDVPMYERLFNADVVVADLSTSNKNAFYELGIRHALKPFTTIVVAEEGMAAPFDVNHIVIRKYKHLGEDIGFEEVMRFRKVLTQAVTEILEKQERERVDSPVYRFVEGLQPPSCAAARGALAEAHATALAAAAAPPAPAPDALSHRILMDQVDDAQDRGDFGTARTLLAAIREMRRPPPGSGASEDPGIVQRLAFATYKSKQPTELQALDDARDLLAALAPATSNDTETLGLWGAVNKRLWALTQLRTYLDQAIRAHQRGFWLRNDHYNGINFAFLLNERAAVQHDPAEAVADFIGARRVRREVIEICDDWLRRNRPPDPATADREAVEQFTEQYYWMLATRGEALLGLGQAEAAQRQLAEAYAVAPRGSWMPDSTREQIGKLEKLLETNPLACIK